MAEGKTGKTLNLTEGNPLKLILLFAIPVFLGRLFQMMYSLIDTKIVGSILGENVANVVLLRTKTFGVCFYFRNIFFILQKELDRKSVV